jgi:hypothetical protein
MDNIFPPTAERHALLAIKRYGALAVLDFSDPPTRKRYLCRCDCEKIIEVPAGALGGVDTYRIYRMMAARVTTAR